MKLPETVLHNREFEMCPVKDCTSPVEEQHHILYDYHDGGPLIRGLCRHHHRWITRRQAHAARKQRHDLSEKQRWFFWFELVKGRMRRPRQTHLDKEWAGDIIYFRRNCK
jgi:hypothetical protein